MALFASIGSTGKLAIGGALVVSAVVGVVVIRQSSNNAPVVGGVPAQILAPEVPVTSVRKTATIAGTTISGTTTASSTVLPAPASGATAASNTASNPASNSASNPASNSAVTTGNTSVAPVPSSVSPNATTSSDTLGAAPLSDQKSLALGAKGDAGVASLPSGGRLIARLDPAPQINVSTAPLDKPQIGAQTGNNTSKTVVLPAKKSKLRFDLVRVDKLGAAVVAGKAIPGQTVDILVNGKEIAQAKANKRGGFVALFDLPDSQTPQVITLTSQGDNGLKTRSSDRVLVMGRAVVEPVATNNAPDNSGNSTTGPTESPNTGETLAKTPQPEAAPAVIIATDEGVKVMQPTEMAQTTPELSANVTIDLISYDSKGEVVLTGRSKPGQHVRVYVDGKPVKTQEVASDGTWQMSLPEVDAGRYTLRVDEINGEGQVTSRIETPFQKEFADSVKRVASNGNLDGGTGGAGLPSVEKVTIQPGATLWALAEANYGQGRLYMQIFNANRDFIRDPDLIYPGQIFTIPK